MTAYYNENDPYAAQWLRNLIDAGHIAPGDVDERSIGDVRGDDLRGYEQCHFFAGIGGWSLALRLAGWPDDRPVWTGSCPCQPFSAAGAGKAADDGRHLWPTWFPLIQELRPAIVFGEQVEAAIGWGWIDAVFADLEGEGYACGQTVLPACSVGAFHIRQRLWFVGHTARGDLRWDSRAGAGAQAQGDQGRCAVGCIGDNPGASGTTGELAHADGRDASAEGLQLGDAPQPGRGGHADGGLDLGGLVNAAGEQAGLPGRARQPGGSHWDACDWLPCTDGKARPVEPGTFPLAHGVRRRTSKLRAYGNAIVPQVAADFIAAAVDSVNE